MRGPGPLDSFGTILSGLAKRLGLEAWLLELRLQREWRDIVGEPIGSHTWPEQIRFKKLYLVVRSSVWMQQLVFLKPELLKRINHTAGTALVTELAMRVGEIPPGRSASEGGGVDDSGRQISDHTLTEATAHAAAIQSPELRERLTRLMAEALSRMPAQSP
ncbi:MAG TPA: DUF721 domain-containing protein [Nitrospira sp.]|nr:DUF721 domain-containing protein [Nitrospira sp.]